MAAETKFTEGRHRDKTYQQVFEKDPEFCKKVLECKESNKYYPAKFKEFLLSKTNIKPKVLETISQKSPKHFLRALSSNMRAELKDIIGSENKVMVRQVHESDFSKTPNGYMGVFYRFFIRKCIFNLQNKDAHNKFVENYASVFPFKVKNEIVNQTKLPVLQLFNDNFKRILQSFLNKHFNDVLLDDVASVFLSNIYLFRQQHFTGKDIKHLKNSVEMMLKDSFDGCGEISNKFRAFRLDNEVNGYLSKFPRLNENGVLRYKSYCQMYNKISQLHHKAEVQNYTKDYLLKIPEINIYELFSLLDKDFFMDHKDQYIEQFEKYVFFFIRALNTDSNPVFFIDSILFECLKSLQTYIKSREDILNLQYECAIMTLVYRRKQPQYYNDGRDSTCDQRNLHLSKDYIENFPGMKTAVVDIEVLSDLLEGTMYVILEDGTSIDIRYSRKKYGGVSDLYESILMGALIPKVKRFVTYNAYRGEESKMDMIPNRDMLLQFIKKYNRWNFLTSMPEETFITWGLENYFVKNTIHQVQEDQYTLPSQAKIFEQK